MLQAASKRFSGLVTSLAVGVMWLSLAAPAAGGPYRDSAHGNSGFGVNRADIDGKYGQYATGNCAHCHEMHASVGGVEPEPPGGAAPHALFADSFNSNRTQNLYVGSDDFCFSCHSEEPGPQVVNQDYSAVFGGASVGSGPQSIMAAFNQTSYHNLYDIWNFLLNNPTYSPAFAKLGNPCSACHNSHLAKRNWNGGQPGFPLLSAVSKPDDHQNLWGEDQLMSAYASYEAPNAVSNSREPAGIGDPDGSNTPDYVAFCTSCHDPNNTISSTILNRDLKKISWRSTDLNQDKHGVLPRDGTASLREPYETAGAFKSNFVLSCMDCHESHGSGNIMLLRRRINGEDLEGVVAATDAMSYACKRCHKDDLAAAAGTGQADKWENVHHLVTGAPYAETSCIDCHGSSDGSLPVACGNCHGHGMDDSWAGANKTGRRTF